MSGERAGRSIFVTVGTTLFDRLVEAATSDDFLALASRPENGGYTDVVVQYGRGKRPAVAPGAEDGCGGGDDGDDGGAFDRTVEVPAPATSGDPGSAPARPVRVRGYRFKPSLEPDMRAADLIVSHAGAGSVTEGVALCSEEESRPPGSGMGRGKKKLAVVINSRLMDDHQRELADAMGGRGYLYVVPDPDLLRDGAVLGEIERFVPAPFPGGDEREFAALLDEHMGFVAAEEATDAKKGR